MHDMQSVKAFCLIKFTEAHPNTISPVALQKMLRTFREALNLTTIPQITPILKMLEKEGKIHKIDRQWCLRLDTDPPIIMKSQDALSIVVDGEFKREFQAYCKEHNLSQQKVLVKAFRLLKAQKP